MPSMHLSHEGVLRHNQNMAGQNNATFQGICIDSGMNTTTLLLITIESITTALLHDYYILQPALLHITTKGLLCNFDSYYYLDTSIATMFHYYKDLLVVIYYILLPLLPLLIPIAWRFGDPDRGGLGIWKWCFTSFYGI